MHVSFLCKSGFTILFHAVQVRRGKGTGFLDAINKIWWLKTKVKLCKTVGWKINKGWKWKVRLKVTLSHKTILSSFRIECS